MRTYADLGLQGQDPAAGRLDRHGRRAAAQPRRRGGRRDLGRLVLRPTSTRRATSASSRPCRRTTTCCPAATPPACTSPASASRRRSRSSAARPTTARRWREALHEVSLDRHAARRRQVRPASATSSARSSSAAAKARAAQLVNTVIKTYPNVSQFWTYDEKEFLAQPGLFARLSAGEESRAVTIGPSKRCGARAPHCLAKFRLRRVGGRP